MHMHIAIRGVSMSEGGISLEEIKKLINDFEKKLSESIRESIAAALNLSAEKKHKHRFQESHNGKSIFCIDCGERYIRDNGFNTALEILKRPHTSNNVDFLSCPECRPRFLSLLKELGYEVKDYGKRIEIRKRK